MASQQKSNGIILLGLGIIGNVHEFIISEESEILPVMLFSLMIIKGIMQLLGKD